VNSSIKFVILCGGSGTRLWPLSRKNRPKQLLPFLNNTSLLEQTIDRISTLATKTKDIGIITTQEQLSLIPNKIINKIGFTLQEPIGRNTGPAILYSCFKIYRKDPDAIVIFLHSDSFIPDTTKYCSYLKKAIAHATKHNDIVTLGLMPTHPATGYGYIQADAQKITAGQAYGVKQFKEKPDRATAKKYLAQGDMFWNIGTFVSKVSLLMQEFETHAPEMFSCVKKFIEKNNGYEVTPSISIDYAVMEKSKNIAIIPCDFEWSDVGNLDTFLSIQQKYEKNDTRIINIDSKNNIVKTDKKIVSFIGLENICVIEDRDVLVIAKRDEVEKVKIVRREV
jgi:mannose-1-phosphate guanylyltransferase/mannose-6-phosphate isomerase